jgi:hypothetical protein
MHRFLRSEYAPDNWGDYGGNRYWCMWANYDHDETRWGWDDWNAAGVPLLRPYVLECLGTGAGGASSRTPRGGDPGLGSTGGQGLVEIQWGQPGQPPRFTDVVRLSPDGRSLSGRNQYGVGVSASTASPGPAPNAGEGLLGTWRWGNSATVECRADGTCTASNGFSGPWGRTGGGFEIRWGRPGQPDQFIDTLTIAPGGQQLSGRNQFGAAVGAARP